MWNPSTNYGEMVGARFNIELRNHMNRHGYSAKSLARHIPALSHRTIESHLAGQNPAWNAIWHYMAFFGPGFLNDLIEPLGMTGAHYLKGDEECPYRLLQELNNTSAAVADAIVDHVITPAEKKTIDGFLTSLTALAQQFRKRKAGRV